MMEFEQSVVPGQSGQDMDLIEVLWRQDIDLGIGREVFDLNLRKELEKEKEIELLKQQEKERQEAEDEAKKETQQQPGVEYVVDGETGELVPVPVRVPDPVSHQQMVPQTSVPTEFGITSQQETQEPMPSIDDMMRILEERVDAGPLSNLSSLSDHGLTADMQQELRSLLDQAQQPEQMELERPGNFEQPWMDIPELMQLNSLVSSNNSGSNGTDPQANAAPMTGSTPYDALVQNASLVPPANYSFAQELGVVGFQPYPDVGVVPGSNLVNNTQIAPPNATLPPTDPGLLQLENQDLLFQTLTGLTPQNLSLTGQDEYLRDLLEDDLNNLDFSDLVLNESNQNILPQNQTSLIVTPLDDASSDSAVSSMDGSLGSPLQDFYDGVQSSPSLYDGLEGATGGTEASAPNKVQNRYEKDEPDHSLADYGYGGEVPMNTSSNGTDYEMSSRVAADARQIDHNHTYPLHQGQQPKDTSKRTPRPSTSASSPNGSPLPYSTRDQKRAKAIGVPFSCDEIVTCPVERFNEMMTKYSLNEPQLQLIRDIRRRGKNKVAAQNCRKRKLDVIGHLDEELYDLRKERDHLAEERRHMHDEKNQVQKKYLTLYNDVFRSLRDDNGHPYDPSQYSLQQTAEGDVFLVPRNTSTTDLHPNSTNRKQKDEERS